MINLSNINISHSFYPGIDLTGIRLGVGSKAGGVPPEPVFDPSSFDQAWTVTGLTNDSPNKTTVKNLTGNGVDLTLNNFAFAGNSGYGLYQTNFENFVVHESNVPVTLVKSYNKIEVEKTADYTNDLIVRMSGANWGFSTSKKVKVTSSDFVTGDILFRDYGNNINVTINVNGITNLPPIGDNVTNVYFTLPVLKLGSFTAELIPDYEGYLVTDGVDDFVSSPKFPLAKDWTMVGDWEFFTTSKRDNSGIVKSNSLFLYNQSDGILVHINRSTLSTLIPNAQSIKAICSDGRIYLDDWSEFIDSVQQTVNGSSNAIMIGGYGVNYTQMAFKNLAFYNDRVLIKDQCIAAYEYLQTLKHPSI